jgi:UDPglucose--hexose-1-phosphate uridylyltransferase
MFRRDVYRRVLLPPESAAGAMPELVGETRWDPLTGHTARIVSGAAAQLAPAADDELARLAETTRQTCPFCPDRIDRVTPRFPPDIATHGRIRVGAAVVFPNLVAYAQHASVGIYGSDRHFIPLNEFTHALIADNIGAQVEFLRGATAADPAAQWTAISANHMLPSGSSLFHPHTQAIAHSAPTTMQRLLADCPRETFLDYLDAERHTAERWLAETTHISWLAAFAPIGPAEIRAFLPAINAAEQLTDEIIVELADGLRTAFLAYFELGYTSFNFALYGAPIAGYPLNLRLIARSPVSSYYRSDATNLERLHWEAAVDLAPEKFTQSATSFFAAL